MSQHSGRFNAIASVRVVTKTIVLASRSKMSAVKTVNASNV